MPRHLLSLAFVCLFTCQAASALAADAVSPEQILLWPEGAPGAKGNEDTDKPSIRMYAPESAKNTGTAIVVCPGGGYGALAIDHEGQQVGEFLRSNGITAFVLKYRLGPKYNHPVPLNDVSRALRYVRAHAKQWNIAPNRVGVMGFSAGGHLASTVSTHFDAGNPQAADPIDRESCRPDFSVLCYAVISFSAPYTHKGSIRNLLGDNPDPELLKSLSNETQVTEKTPPAFLFHTQEDTAVPPQNALAYYSALVEKKVPAELHLYQYGAHGVGLAIGDPVLTTWKDRLIGWLQTSGLLCDVKRAQVEGKVTIDGTPLSWGTVTFTSDIPGAPVAGAIVRRGSYKIPAARGPAVGRNTLTIKTMGDVEPQPTIKDVQVLSDGEIVVEVRTEKPHTFDVDLKSKSR
ncbi:MAG TPA: alpha/beta hydrolase [Caulifigura sp.]|nr:alpha/beta hydrolase [Caulifigura sp.]